MLLHVETAFAHLSSNPICSYQNSQFMVHKFTLLLVTGFYDQLPQL